MNFELTEIQRETQKMCREFAARELQPNARRWDESHEWPGEAVKKLAELQTKSVSKFIGTGHSADDLRKIADFLSVVADAIKSESRGKTLQRAGDTWALIEGQASA